MPDGYVLSTPDEMIVPHAEIRRAFEGREAAGDRPAVATLASPFPEREYTELAVCTRDRPGLFAMISGVLAAHGLNILAARITTSLDRVALDVFRITHQSGEAELDTERWERVAQTLRRVLGGEIEIETLVQRSRRPSILNRPRRPVTTRVEIDNQVSGQHTVLDVFTGDRVGLLFTITNCLRHLGLEVHLAKITTMVDQVLDVFYVTDEEGRKSEDANRLSRIRDELEAALTEGADAPDARDARAAGG
jgi:[protein-PII] uridylyltransferase